jgi:hypothetical protein
MGKGNTTSNDILKCILKGIDPTYRNANATLYVSLHTADPTATGLQTTNEVAYTDYERRPITKATGWTDNGTSFANAALIQFPICGAVGATIRYIAIGELNTGGAGQIYYIGQISADLTVITNIQPQFSPGNLQVTES